MADGELRLGATNNRQVLLVAGAALGAALLLFLIWYLVIRTPYAPAFTDLKSADASLIVEELKRQKTPYDLADNGTTIRVPEDQVDAVRVNVLGGDLPLKGTVGFELFNQSDMGLTEFAQKINYQRALQGELARTLMSLENVDTARVHLSLPDSGIFERDRRAAKASVTIAPKLGKKFDGPTVTGIQRLVASAVPDLDTTNVAVLDAEGQLLSQEVIASTLADGGVTGSPLEQEYAARVKSAIAPLLPDPNTRVSVKIAQDLVQDEETPAGDGSTQAVGAGGRPFPIRISIISPTVPASTLRNDLVPYLTESVDYDPSRGDSFLLLTSPTVLPPAPIASRAPRVAEDAKADWEPRTSLSTGSWLWLIFGALVIAIILFVARRSASPSAMSADQREAFADRLKALVDEQGGRSSGAV